MEALSEIRAVLAAQLKMWWRRRAAAIASLLSDPIWFLIFAIPMLLFGGDRASTLNFTVWGWFFFIAVSDNLWTVAGNLRYDIIQGTYEILLLTNARRPLFFIGRGLRAYITSMASLGLMALLVSLGFGVPIMMKHPLLMVFVIALGFIATYSFALIYACLVHISRSTMVITNIVQFLLPLVTGLFIPLTVFPEQVRVALLILPFSEMGDLARYAAMGTPTILDPALELLVYLATTLAQTILAVAFMSWAERRSKVKGTVIKSW